jgi:mannose-1-phosphate guanylyltransferase/mannose-6-phosphate isomerase
MIEEQRFADNAVIIAESVARNTAPAVGVAASNREPDEILLVLPSDYMIKHVAALHSSIQLSMEKAKQGWLITFGVPPVRLETGYGYIRAGAPIGPGIGFCRETGTSGRGDVPAPGQSLLKRWHLSVPGRNCDRRSS